MFLEDRYANMSVKNLESVILVPEGKSGTCGERAVAQCYVHKQKNFQR